MPSTCSRTLVGALVFVVAGHLAGQQTNLGYDDTPMQPNGRWHIHGGPTHVRRHGQEPFTGEHAPVLDQKVEGGGV